ncbi:hypothetical protein VCRA2119O48_140109 [Vibrio crassostreae]|nr:hypothetical protein VCRA2119O48_140109 [Vibrio crassostreae]CAK3851842.1 hypothetical protein VCRA2121O335_300038 [Vibrio crassostreae]
MLNHIVESWTTANKTQLIKVLHNENNTDKKSTRTRYGRHGWIWLEVY